MKGHVIITEDGPIEIGDSIVEQALVHEIIVLQGRMREMVKTVEKMDDIFQRNVGRHEQLRKELWGLLATTGFGGFVLGLLFARVWWNI